MVPTAPSPSPSPLTFPGLVDEYRQNQGLLTSRSVQTDVKGPPPPRRRDPRINPLGMNRFSSPPLPNVSCDSPTRSHGTDTVDSIPERFGGVEGNTTPLPSTVVRQVPAQVPQGTFELITETCLETVERHGHTS